MAGAFAVIAASVVPAAGAAQGKPLAIVNTTVIDGTANGARTGMTVVIDGNRIAAVGPTKGLHVPRQATVIDGTGKYVIPGLWDMHVHITKAGKTSLPMFVANGVTSIRDMGGDFAALRAWRDEVTSGRLLGPRIVAAGPILESPSTRERMEKTGTLEPWWRTRVFVNGPADAARIVDSVLALGVDFLKIRNSASAETYFAIAAQARRRGVPLVGHAPWTIDPVMAADSGQRSFDHGFYPFPLDSAEGGAARVIEAFRRNNVVLVPTIVSWAARLRTLDSVAAVVHDSAGRLDPRRRYVASVLVDDWKEQLEDRAGEPADAARAFRRNLEQNMRDLLSLHRAGVLVMPGTDVATLLVYPGFSLHDELVWFVDGIGLTPLEALQSATRLPAEFMGRGAELGTVAAGKLADLVLLEANPLSDIGNTRAIAGVVHDGVYLAAAELRSRLPQFAAAARAEQGWWERAGQRAGQWAGSHAADGHASTIDAISDQVSRAMDPAVDSMLQARLSPERRVQYLRARLFGGSRSEIRLRAVEDLATLPDGTGVPVLREAVAHHPDAGIREAAAAALRRVGER